MQKLIMILAATPRGEIGYKNQLPWKLKYDLKNFRQLTIDQVVIMGRKTFESLGSCPLPERINFVVSESIGHHSWVFPSIEDAVEAARERYPEKDIFLIGGVSLYEYGLKHADRIELTLVADTKERLQIEYDTAIPNFQESMSSDTWKQMVVHNVFEKVSENSALSIPSHSFIRFDRCSK